MNKIFLIIFFLGIFVLLSKGVYAYLDLGTGSYVFQMTLGAILGGIFTVKLYYHKIIKFIKKIKNTTNKEKHNDKKE